MRFYLGLFFALCVSSAAYASEDLTNIVDVNSQPDSSVTVSEPVPEVTNTTPVSSEPKKWEFLLTPYAFAPQLSGDATLSGYTTPEFSAKLKDLVKVLDFTAAGRAEAWYKGKWGTILDVDYMDLGKGFEVRRTKFDLDVKEAIFDVAGSYRFKFNAPSKLKEPSLYVEPILGARLMYLKQKVQITPGPILGLFGAPNPRIGGEETYLEPFVGTNIRYQPWKRFSFGVRGDVGGFGLGSHFTWNLIPTFNIHFNKTVALNLGYAIKDINYGTGNARSGFGQDSRLRGPWFGLTFKF